MLLGLKTKIVLGSQLWPSLAEHLDANCHTDENGSTRVRTPGELIFDKLFGQEFS